jgi:hypothetical protein
MDRLTALGFRKDEMVEALQDHAYEELYGCNVPLNVRRVLRCVIRLQEECKSHPTAEKLNERVRIANRVSSRSTARTDIRRAVDCSLISEEEDGRETFYFLSADQLDKASKLRHLLDAIPSRLTPTKEGRPS